MLVIGPHCFTDPFSFSQIALDRMAVDDMRCEEWCVLLNKAEAQWKDFLFVLAQRAPDDDWIKALTSTERTTE